MKINFYATFRPIVGSKSITIPMPPGSTVSQLIQCIIEQYPALGPQLLSEDGKLFQHVHVFVNGRDAPYLPQAMETVLKSEDSIDIFPPVGGG